ncbi:MAG TPA: LysR substrate-binding domain-containing protein [Burkholderiaceae bacterium]|nr:LysR substrate-binding domain-containing protein [Burkholderiaceae bacterium]
MLTMSRIPLHTLPSFRVIARTGNLRAAADELHLTHSAVSQQLRLLETQLGFELFDRRARRIVLNAAGSALLQAIGPALDQVEDGVRSATAAASGAQQRLRVSVLPSFAQRWLLPRMGDWHAKHSDIALEINASQQVVDLQRDGFHAALRQGSGVWRGLHADRLIDSPRVPVGSPQAAQRLTGKDVAALAHEPLLGQADLWEQWFALSGLKVRVNPVAVFNDAGLMLQAAEQNMGIALSREVLAADALRERRLFRLSSLALQEAMVDAYWLVYPPDLHDWLPLATLRRWLHTQIDASARAWSASDASPMSTHAGHAASVKTAAGKVAADPIKNRNRVRSGAPMSRRAR